MTHKLRFLPVSVSVHKQKSLDASEQDGEIIDRMMSEYDKKRGTV